MSAAQTNDPIRGNELSLKVLQPSDVEAIDLALREVGPYGEVHLVIENGRLRFIRTVRSQAVAGIITGKTKSSNK